MSGLSLPILGAIFAAGVAAIWVAGIQLSKSVDIIDNRLGLGEALGGLILLAVATNLPEIAIVSTAAARHNFDIATGNVLGGIAIQTVVLVALDGFGVPRRALTNATASLSQVLEGALVMAILAVAIMATLLPQKVVVARIDPSTVLITLTWIGGLLLIRRAAKGLPWRQVSAGDSPDAGPRKRGKTEKTKPPFVVAVIIFVAAAIVTLVAGIGLELSGNAIADQIHLNGAVFGATVLAAATALPELSTGLAAVKDEDFELAVSDIFGGNAFLPVLFFPATLLAGAPILGKAAKTDVFMAALGILLTGVYVFGLIFRPQKQYLRLGPDSIAVLVLYVVGIAGLIAINSG
jgi:cation:H+ antiporter